MRVATITLSIGYEMINRVSLATLCDIVQSDGSNISSHAATLDAAASKQNWESQEDLLSACKVIIRSVEVSESWKFFLCDEFSGRALVLCAEAVSGVDAIHPTFNDVSSMVKILCDAMGPRNFHMITIETFFLGSDSSTFCPSRMNLFTVAALCCLPQLNPHFTVSTYEAIFAEMAKYTSLSTDDNTADQNSWSSCAVQSAVDLFRFSVRFCEDYLSLMQQRASDGSRTSLEFVRDCSIGFLLKLLQRMCQMHITAIAGPSLNSCIDDLVLFVINFAGDMDCIVNHPFRVRMYMCDLYTQICGSSSFQKVQALTKKNEEFYEYHSQEANRTVSSDTEEQMSEIQLVGAVNKLRSYNFPTDRCFSHHFHRSGLLNYIPWDSVTDETLLELFELYNEHCPERKSLHARSKWSARDGSVWTGAVFHEVFRWPLTAAAMVSAYYFSSRIRPRVYSVTFLSACCRPFLISAFRDFPELYRGSNMTLNLDTDNPAQYDFSALSNETEDDTTISSSFSESKQLGLRLFCCVNGPRKADVPCLSQANEDYIYSDFAALKGKDFWKKAIRDSVVDASTKSGRHNSVTSAVGRIEFGGIISSSHDLLISVQLVVTAMATCTAMVLVKDSIVALKGFLNVIPSAYRIGLLRKLCLDCPYKQVSGVLLDCVRENFQAGARLIESSMAGRDVSKVPEIASEIISDELTWLKTIDVKDYHDIYSGLSDSKQSALIDQVLMTTGIEYNRLLGAGLDSIPFVGCVSVVLREFIIPKLKAYDKIGVCELQASGSDELLSLLGLVTAVGMFSGRLQRTYDDILLKYTSTVGELILCEDSTVTLLQYLKDHLDRLKNQLARGYTLSNASVDASADPSQLTLVLFLVDRSVDSINSFVGMKKETMKRLE